MSDSILIVGAGHAGGRVAEHLRAQGHTGQIRMLGDEGRLPYERPALSKEILHGTKCEADIRLREQDAWDTLDVEVETDAPVAAFLPHQGSVTLANGRNVPFDRMVIATGGKARRFDVPGHDDPRVMTLRTLEDGLTLATHLPALTRLTVIGGGVIGLEVAAAAAKHGVAVTILEAAPRAMGRIGPPLLSDWLAARHRAAGTTLHLGCRVEAIVPDETSLKVEATAADGTQVSVASDLVLVCVGIVPATGWLDGTGLAGRNGIETDAFCRTADQRVMAVGDVALTFSPLFGTWIRQETWRNAENQARAAAEILCGRDAPYVEIPWMWSDQFDHNIQVVGRWDDQATAIARGAFGEPGTGCIFIENGVVTGGVLIDLGRDRRFLERMVAERRPADPRQLADPTIPLRTL